MGHAPRDDDLDEMQEAVEEDEEEEEVNDDGDQPEPIYDHNRNLNLSEPFGDKKELTTEVDEEHRGGRLSDGDEDNGAAPMKKPAEARRGNNNASPVLSLAASDGLASGCSSSTDTNPTTCSTQRLSQNSLSQIIEQQHQQIIKEDNEETKHHHSANPPPTSHQHRITFDEVPTTRHFLRPPSDEDGHRGRDHNEDDDDDDEKGPEPNEESVMIRMIDTADTAGNRVDIVRVDGTHGTSGEHVGDLGLAKHLGRRVSALPHLFGGGRKCKSALPMHEQLNQHRMCRSHSLQQSIPISLPPESQVPTTVAGVGGTITTVTRGHRKTAPLPRLVAKNGTVNLFLDNIDRSQYVRDLFTTMIDIKWRYNLMAAAFGFVFSWLFFACVWYLVLFVHNDLSHENDPNWSPCIVNVNSFPAALLFSIETQSTLGFGSRIISVECPGAIVIFCVQLIFGVVIECLIVGMVFAKLSRPAKRSQTIMYSKYATVCLREGKMCLTFRVGDVRSKSHIIGATIRASLVSQKVTEEGEQIPFYHHQLEVKIDDSRNQLLLIWPVTIVHHIDEHSPFYKLDAEKLANFKFEIITVLEGTVESTGQSIQVRSSYLPSEVKWGYRFEPIVSAHGCGRYAQTIIDYNKFNRILAVDTPRCSPEDYYKQKATTNSQ